MSLKVVDVGNKKNLDRLTTAWGNNAILKLFKNNITPAAGDTLATYTECDFSGYAASNCTGWSAAATVSGRASSTAAQKTFTHNTGLTANDIYGYYVVDPDTTTLLWAERDANAPIHVANNGDAYLVTPVFTQASEF